MTDQQKEFGHYHPLRDTTPHPYNDPSIGPLEFLLRVMRDAMLPIAARIEAAKAAAPFFTPRPGERHYPCVSHHLEYIIPENHLLREALRQDQEPRTAERNSSPKDPDGDYGISQSFSLGASNNHPPQSGPVAPDNMTTTSYPPSFIDYSHPPSPEVFAAAARHGLPEPHLCPCGHWITGSYPCCEALSSRDPSKLN